MPPRVTSLLRSCHELGGVPGHPNHYYLVVLSMKKILLYDRLISVSGQVNIPGKTPDAPPGMLALHLLARKLSRYAHCCNSKGLQVLCSVQTVTPACSHLAAVGCTTRI